MKNYQEMCYNTERLTIKMPKPNKIQKVFENLMGRWFAARVIYFDLESIIVPVPGPARNPATSNTQTVEIHNPCSYGLVVVEHGTSTPIKYEMCREPDAIKKLIKSLESLAREIYNDEGKYFTFVGQPKLPKEAADIYWICEEQFAEESMMVVDHCHVINKFLGSAHHDCNLARRTPNFTPVVAHNLSNYDMHAIVKALHNANLKNKFSLVPSTDEKYFSLWIKEIRDKDGKKDKFMRVFG